MSEICLRAHVLGHVQGVGFRAFVVDRAQALGLAGWVRNRRDGSVEAVFSGPEDEVHEMVRLCHDGPPDAKVTKVTVTDEGGAPPSGFTVLPTD